MRPCACDVLLWRIGSLSFLVLELDTSCGVGSQFHASAALPPRESVFFTPWVGRWVGPRNFNALQKRKVSPFCRESNHDYTVVQTGVFDSNLIRGSVAFSREFLCFSSVALGEFLDYFIKDAMENFSRLFHRSHKLDMCEVFWCCYILHQLWSSRCIFKRPT